MAKSKYAPALFEVINSEKGPEKAGKLSLPKWWRGGEKTAPGQPRPSEPLTAGSEAVDAQEPPAVRAQPVAARPEPAAAPAAPPARPAREEPSIETARYREPLGERLAIGSIVRAQNGRIVLSLNPVSATVVGGVLLLALFTAYQLGAFMDSGPTPTPTNAGDASLQAMVGGEAKPSVLKPADAAPKPAKPVRDTRAADKPADPRPLAPLAAGVPTGQAAELKPGLHYVVFDTYSAADGDAAQHVQAWLAEAYGIKTVLKTRSGNFELLSADGFDYADSGQKEQAAKLVERVKGLGNECRQELSKARLPVYRFSSPMIKKIG